MVANQQHSHHDSRSIVFRQIAFKAQDADSTSIRIRTLQQSLAVASEPISVQTCAACTHYQKTM